MTDRSPSGRLRASLLLFLALTIALPASAIRPPSAIASPNEQLAVSEVIPFLGLARGWRRRNRVYRTANAYIADRRAYYDTLREKAREQLRNREMLDLKDSQVAAYRRMVTMIEQERAATIAFAESEKRAAREQFLQTVESAILTRMLGSGLAQDLFRALSKGINSAQGALDVALDQLSGGSGFMAEVARVRRIAVKVRAVSPVIGGEAGEKLRRASERIIETVDRPKEEIEAGINQVQAELGQLGSSVAELQDLDRTVNVSQVTRQAAVTILTGEDSDDPAIDAIIAVLAGKSRREGSSFKDRARGALLGNFVARCASFGERYRRELELLEDEPDAEPPSNEEVFSPCNAIDLAALAQEVAEEEAAQGDEEGSAEKPGDGPSISYQSVTKTRDNCGGFFSEEDEGVFCDIDLSITVAYQNFEESGVISCEAVTRVSMGETQVGAGSGTAIFSVTYERTNYTLFEGDLLLIQCRATAGDQPAGSIVVIGNETEWSE